MSNTNVSYSSDSDSADKPKKNMTSTKHAASMRATSGSITVAEDKGGVSLVVVADTVTMTQHFHF